MHRRVHNTRRVMGALLVVAMLSPGLSYAVCTAGFNNPSANASDTGGDSINGKGGYESNPTKAYIAEPTPAFAVDSNSGSLTGTTCTSPGKDRHRFYNYGFNLPTGATIQGIELQLKAKVSSASNSPMICAEFSWDGGATWTTDTAGVLSTRTLSTTNTVYTLGGPTNTWGRSWAAADFNNANLRVRLTDVAGNNSRKFSLDYVGVKVSCTAPTLPTVSFNSSTSQGSENLLYSDISVSLSAASTQTVTVNWAVASPPATTATASQDYFILPSGTTSGTLSFAPGEVRKTLRLLVIPDNNVGEADEIVGLTLSNPSSNATLGAITAHTFTIYNTPTRGVAGDFTADVVLGQRDHTESTTNKVIPNHVLNVGGVVVDRGSATRPTGQYGRAYVWDGGNNRILGFNLGDLDTCGDYPNLTQACTPVLVIGQPSGTDFGSCNQDASMSRYPYLAPASASTLCGTAAWYISPKEGARRSSMAVDQTTGDLYVPDYENHRVLVFNNPFTDSTPAIADDVIGQDDFSGVYCNKDPYKRSGNYDGSIDSSTPISAPSASSLCAMHKQEYLAAFGSYTVDQGFGVALDGLRNLWVADGGNNRVLRFPRDTATNKISKTADVVLGQPNLPDGKPDFTSRTGGTGLDQMQGPTSLAFGPDGKLYVADGSMTPQDDQPYDNSRVLVFTPPFTVKTGAKFSGAGRTDFDRPYVAGVNIGNPLVDGLWISRWVSAVPNVVEQYNWQDSTLIRTLGRWPGVKNSYDGSIDVDKAGNVLVPGGRDLSDVVIYKNNQWDQPPTTTLLPPSFLYNITSGNHMSHPVGIATAWNQLYVADEHRIMIWNNLDQLTNGKPADSFIGQLNFDSSDYIFNGNNPYWQMKVDTKLRLWVASRDRIFVFQPPLYTWSKPIKVIQGPFPVLGSSEEISVLSDFGREFGLVPMVTTVNGVSKDFLWIAQPFNHRVFRIRDPLGLDQTNPGPLVDMVLGQSDLTVDPQTGLQICNRGAPVPTTALNLLCYPYNLSIDRNRDLYVSDHMTEGQGNLRMLMFKTSLFPTDNLSAIYDLSAEKAFPQATFEAAFNTAVTADPTNRMVTGFDSYGGHSPYVGIYENPGLSSVTAPTCSTTPPAGPEPDCYLNDHTLMAGAATFDQLGNLYVADGNRTKVFIYKQPFKTIPGSQFPTHYAMTKVSAQIVASSDAAYTCGSSTITSGYTYVGKWPAGACEYTAGLRFTNINIPSTATIDNAVIIFKPTWFNTHVEPLKVKISGVRDPSSTTFSSGQLLTNLTKTAATAPLDDSDNGPWVQEHWHATPNLSTIAQEIIGLSGWETGNKSMAFLISNDGTPNERAFFGYDTIDPNNPYDRNYSPILYIQYH